MANQTYAPTALLDYVREVSLRDDPVLADLRYFTAELPGGRAMQVMAEEGQFLALLVRLTGARVVVEIGTYTGYSALCMARALPEDGFLTTCDITDKWPAIAAQYWRRAQVDGRIGVRVGDARETLAELIAQWGGGSVDLVFIDADKAGYPAYYEAALTLVRPGGLIVVDNTLFFGRVVDPAADDPDTAGVRELNTLLLKDERVDLSLLPVADGVTLVRKH
jgi:O-methyltransferase